MVRHSRTLLPKKIGRFRSWGRISTIASIASLAAGCSPPEPPPENRTVVDDAALSDEGRGENWLAFGRTYSEQRFSPLTQISDANVGELGVDWFIDLPE